MTSKDNHGFYEMTLDVVLDFFKGKTGILEETPVYFLPYFPHYETQDHLLDIIKNRILEDFVALSFQIFYDIILIVIWLAQ